LVSATDDHDPAPDVVCTPPSPSIFPIGTTQVQCTATDEAGNTTTGAFSVTVRGQYEELAFDVEALEGTIASNLRDGLPSDRLEDALTKLEAAREEFSRTPTDRLAALGHLQAATQNLSTAFEEGEISAFGFDVIVRRFAGNSWLTADQAIAEAKARGGNAEAIADAEAALAKGDEKRAAREFTDAVAQYRKACRVATGA
jgi:HYR domain-containing protein